MWLSARGKAAEQLDGVRSGRYAELILQGVRAEPVLPAHELLLVLQGVTAHQQAVGGLAALIGRERQLAELHGDGEIALFEVDFGEALDGLQVPLLETALLGKVPVAVPVVLEERPTVKPNRPLVGVDRLPGLAAAP